MKLAFGFQIVAIRTQSSLINFFLASLRHATAALAKVVAKVVSPRLVRHLNYEIVSTGILGGDGLWPGI